MEIRPAEKCRKYKRRKLATTNILKPLCRKGFRFRLEQKFLPFFDNETAIWRQHVLSKFSKNSIMGRGDEMARPVQTIIEVNEATGEITGHTAVYVSPPQSEPPYVKVYFSAFSCLRTLPLYCWPVLVWLLRLMPYANADPVFEFGTPMRRKAAADLELSVGRVDHAVSDLMKCGVLLRSDRGLYQFNPVFFARGEWKDIQKLRSCGR